MEIKKMIVQDIGNYHIGGILIVDSIYCYLITFVKYFLRSFQSHFY